MSNSEADFSLKIRENFDKGEYTNKFSLIINSKLVAARPSVEYMHLPDTFIFPVLNSPADVAAALEITRRSHVRYVKSQCFGYFTNPHIKFALLNERLKDKQVEIENRNHTRGFQRIYQMRYGAVVEELDVKKYGTVNHIVKGFRTYDQVETAFVDITRATINGHQVNNININTEVLLNLIENIFNMREQWLPTDLQLTVFQQRKLLDVLLPFVFCNYYLESSRNPAHMIFHPFLMRKIIHEQKKTFKEAIETSPMSKKDAASHARVVHHDIIDRIRFFEGSTKVSSPKQKEFKKQQTDALQLLEHKSPDQLQQEAFRFWSSEPVTGPSFMEKLDAAAAARAMSV